MRHAVELGGQRHEPRALEEHRDADAEGEAAERSRGADPRAGGEEDAAHGARRGAENRQHRGVARARRGEHGGRGREVQARDDHDQEHGREEDRPLEPQREDEGAVLLLPRRDRDRRAERRGNRRRGPGRMLGIRQAQLVARRAVRPEREQTARLLERHRGLRGLASRGGGRDARDLHRRDDRHGPERRQARTRRDERDRLARDEADRPRLRHVEDEPLLLLAPDDHRRHRLRAEAHPDPPLRDGRDGRDARHGGELPRDPVDVVELPAPRGRHEQVRRLGEEASPDVRLEAREKRERHDERRDAEQEPEERRERDDPHLRVAPRREEISLGEEERDHFGRISGKRITSRMEWEFVKSIARRSMPTPSPAVGGIP